MITTNHMWLPSMWNMLVCTEKSWKRQTSARTYSQKGALDECDIYKKKYLSNFFSVWGACTYVYIYVCTDAHAHAPMCGGQRMISVVYVFLPFFFFLRWVSYWTWSSEARLASNWVLVTHPPLLLIAGLQKFSTVPGFLGVLGNLNSCCHVHVPRTLSIEPSFQPLS